VVSAYVRQYQRLWHLFSDRRRPGSCRRSVQMLRGTGREKGIKGSVSIRLASHVRFGRRGGRTHHHAWQHLLDGTYCGSRWAVFVDGDHKRTLAAPALFGELSVIYGQRAYSRLASWSIIVAQMARSSSRSTLRYLTVWLSRRPVTTYHAGAWEEFMAMEIGHRTAAGTSDGVDTYTSSAAGRRWWFLPGLCDVVYIPTKFSTSCPMIRRPPGLP